MAAPPLVCSVESIRLTLDVRRMGFGDDFLASLAPRLQRAFDAMAALEAGAIANPDEGRQVGHYWLRTPELAPSPELRTAIIDTVSRIKSFAADVHAGRIAPEGSAKYTDVLVVGIGGSALGPQLVSRALGAGRADPLEVHFLDNTDPDGFDFVLDRLAPRLKSTLVLVISKSGGTKETRNGMLEVKWAMEKQSLAFAPRAVAITGEGSALDRTAVAEGWLARFPMWDWVGGRTSELSAVGLLPAALQGFDIDQLLEGGRLADQATRARDVHQNPAALLAAAWWFAGNGRGTKDMVILPYRDRLELFARYLQQLVMESIGKEKDLDGKVVQQGIAVYGNKGSTDQHAYVQQLREGIPNFFATFIQVLRDRADGRPSREVEGGVTSGDYLFGFLQGTQRALHEAGRPSLTITVEDVDARCVGALIALFERAVGLYALLVNINAYHQPGVEAGKKAASEVIALQGKLVSYLRSNPGPHGGQDLARALGAQDAETVIAICQHLAANPGRGVKIHGSLCAPWTAQFSAE